MTVTSVLLLILAPALVIAVGPVIGRPYPEVVAALSNPLRALVLGSALLAGLVHFRMGMQVVLEDYAHGAARQAMVIAMIAVTYAILAAGLLAILRLAV